MAFLRSSLMPELEPQLRGPRVWLRPPLMSDYMAWAELRSGSRAHLSPWEPAWAYDELSRSSFRRRIKVHQRDQREDVGYAFFIFASATEQLLGGITLSNVRRGVTQAGALGYWIGAPFTRTGLMTESVALVCRFAFDTLGLHRVEAACLPNNVASMTVLERNGFQREGLARRYLKIDGRWQDHVLFALLNDDPPPVHRRTR
ncbi:MAG: GNAT family N-acetyltransferase [Hyphomicrobiaceae bacterium]